MYYVLTPTNTRIYCNSFELAQQVSDGMPGSEVRNSSVKLRLRDSYNYIEPIEVDKLREES